MQDRFSIEELVIDDSFISYCLQKNEADILHWQQYLRDHPLEKSKIEEAEQLVLGLHVMLKQTHSDVGGTQEIRETSDHLALRPIFRKGFLRYAAVIAASVMVLWVLGVLIRNSFKNVGQSQQQLAVIQSSDEVHFYRTLNGERKAIVLSDSTKIWLNAGSELRIDESYGKKDRQVYLSGEALFEVAHDESMPFIVSTHSYEIKDLGTVFNVKAYPNENESETSLIEGKVEIKVKRDNRKILLSPNQKAIISDEDGKSSEPLFKTKPGLSAVAGAEVKLSTVSYSPRDSAVIETAWAKNRLEIVNEDFFEMKKKLERWYDVEIAIDDDEVGKYPFTATFEEESIREVLQALQYAYHFNYSIKDKKISISK